MVHISAITKRFDQINTFNNVFEFLYDVGKLCYVPDLEILNCCKDWKYIMCYAFKIL